MKASIGPSRETSSLHLSKYLSMVVLTCLCAALDLARLISSLKYRGDPGEYPLSVTVLIGKLHFCQAHIETQLAKAELSWPYFKDLEPPQQRKMFISTAEVILSSRAH